MKYLIAGRTGSGKDYLARLLEQRGLRVLKSYATRPRRTPDEDTHIFIKQEEVDRYKESEDIIAYTKIGAYEYFATKQQVLDCDVYIIDPDGIDYLLSHMQNTSFQIIYIIADEEKKQEMALSRAPDERKDKELETYKARCAAEDKQFSDFERKIALKHAPKQEPSSENERRKQNNVNREKLISRTNVFVNVYDKNASKRYADKLTNDLRSWNKIYDKLQEEVKSGNIMIRTGYLEQLTDCLYQGM